MAVTVNFKTASKRVNSTGVVAVMLPPFPVILMNLVLLKIHRSY